ncbi:MAG: SAM-dependent methyltransferase [Candidatus Hydrogenedentota bacterium]|nr:MAG: SAM-dependent methyltransferase [Candidatus Hydrogenedentota bacterium]
MGFYSNVLFPALLDKVMSTGQMHKARHALLSNAQGTVFEIGFGTGLNLQHYPETVSEITTADINPGMNKRALQRIAESPIKVDHNVINGESLPFEDESFDTVVCTWTLCSIKNVDAALQQVRRILKPKGKFLFVEHGLADDPKVQKWQHRLNPLQQRIGDGCNLNRNMKELIQDNHFSFDTMDTFYMPKSPRFAGFMYQGIASKA